MCNQDFMSRFPWSNAHELNLDWVLEETKQAKELAQKAINIVINWVPAEGQPAIRTIVGGGKPLTDDNFKDEFVKALEKSKFIFIPKGEYNFDKIGEITVNTDCDILCDSGVVFYRNVGTDAMLDFIGCQVKIEGLEIRSGTSDDTTVMLYKPFSMGGRGESEGSLYFDNCHNIEISNVFTTRSKMPSVIVLRNCEHTHIHDCSFVNVLENAIHILYTCVDTVIENCVFKDIKMPTSPSDIWYCYAVSTGAVALDAPTWTPPDILVYRNNIVMNSEDSGLDTHGATNVVIDNNKIINCGTCITAYNDSRRVNRPDNWVMRNVRITNNFCSSNFVNEIKKHPYILVASSDSELNCEGLVVDNNYFESPNTTSTYGPSMMPVQGWRSATITNNIFKSKTARSRGIMLYFTTAIIENNVFDVDSFGIHNYLGARTIARSNQMSFASQTTEGLNYLSIDEDSNAHDMLVNKYDFVVGGSATTALKISTTNGIALNNESTLKPAKFNFNVMTISNSRIKLVPAAAGDVFPVFPGLNMTLDDTSTIYITKVLSETEAEFYRAGSPIADGAHTARPANANILTFTPTH